MVVRPSVSQIAAAVSVAACLVAPSGASAIRTPGAGDLSPRLAILAKPAVRTAPDAVQAKKLGLPDEGAGSLLRRGNRVLAYVRFERGAVAGLDALRAAGAQVVDASRRYQTVTVAAKPDQLREVGAVANVGSVSEALAPVTAEACPSQGAVISQGDAQLHAAEARAGAPEPDGSGVTVGILSDSLDEAEEAADGSGPVAKNATEDEESGDLPGPNSPCEEEGVNVLEEIGSGAEEEATDEGRAMAQIVHDLAPGAKIAFASAFNGETAFAKNIEELAKPASEGGPEAKVIADDVFYLEEPFFQDGPIAVAAGEAVEDGATYLSAAGNDNLVDTAGNDIASWEAPEFRDSGGCPQAVQSLSGAKGTHCMDFNPGSQTDRTFGIKVEPGATLAVDLQWDEPWNGVKTDLDAFLLSANGNLIGLEAGDNLETQRPTEILQWENESSSETKTVQLVINRYAGNSPRIKFGLLENGSGVSETEYPRSTDTDKVGPTIFGHSGASSVISVGAIPFYEDNEVEYYSSRGPVRHDFGPVAGGSEPAAPVGPELVPKPDVVATDCGVTTFFSFFGKFPENEPAAAWHFCGTSAAAPHAAAVVALMLDADPAAQPAELRTALLESAAEVSGSPPCATGAGMVDAVAAVADLLSPGAGVISSCLEPGSEVAPDEAAAPGSWGLESPPIAATAQPTAGSSPPVEEAEMPRRRLPRTFFRRHPHHLIHTHHHRARVVFRFGSNEHHASFVCRIDNGLFRPCPARLVRRLPVGWHSLRVSARNAEGLGDRSPAFFRFRIKRVG